MFSTFAGGFLQRLLRNASRFVRSFFGVRTVEHGGFLCELTLLAEILLDAQPVAIQLGQMI